MKKILVILLGFVLMFSLVFAAEQDNSQAVVTGSENLGSVGEQQGESQEFAEVVQTQAREGERLQLKEGNHIGENGQQMRVQQENNNQIRLEVGGSSAKSSMNVNQETVNGKTKLTTQLSNGNNAEIKVMPDVASGKALEQLRLKNCTEDSGCSIELKEVGSGENVRAAYEVNAQKQSKVLGLFKAKMQVKAQIDAENGEVLKVNKPWWSFLATESKE